MKTERSPSPQENTGFDWGTALLTAAAIAIVVTVLVIAVVGMLWEAGAF